MNGFYNLSVNIILTNPVFRQDQSQFFFVVIVAALQVSPTKITTAQLAYCVVSK